MGDVFFDVGERVRVITNSTFNGDEGTIKVRNRIDNRWIYGIDFETGGSELYFYHDEVEKMRL